MSSTQMLFGIDLETWQAFLCRVLIYAMLFGSDPRVAPAMAGELCVAKGTD